MKPFTVCICRMPPRVHRRVITASLDTDLSSCEACVKSFNCIILFIVPTTLEGGCGYSQVAGEDTEAQWG